MSWRKPATPLPRDKKLYTLETMNKHFGSLIRASLTILQTGSVSLGFFWVVGRNILEIPRKIPESSVVLLAGQSSEYRANRWLMPTWHLAGQQCKTVRQQRPCKIVELRQKLNEMEKVCAHFTCTGSSKPAKGYPMKCLQPTMRLTTNPIRIHLLANKPEEIRIHCSSIQPCSLADSIRNLRRIAIKSTPVDQMCVIENNEREKG